jgi:hypothetical protein
MDDQRSNQSPTAHDIAGAWLFCVLLAMLGLGLTFKVHGTLPPSATEFVEWSSCAQVSGPGCRPSPDMAESGVGVLSASRSHPPHQNDAHRPG